MKQILIEDTRQQDGKHERKHDWWRAHGVEVVRRKLDFGDYATDASNVSVDTKRNLQEVAMDCGRDHDRFVREMERAREAGHRLVILVETTGNYRNVGDVSRWVNDVCGRCEFLRNGECADGARCRRFKRRPMAGKTLASIMERMQVNHGCMFELCHPRMAAKRVCDLLGVRYEAYRWWANE